MQPRQDRRSLTSKAGGNQLLFPERGLHPLQGGAGAGELLGSGHEALAEEGASSAESSTWQRSDPYLTTRSLAQEKMHHANQNPDDREQTR